MYCSNRAVKISRITERFLLRLLIWWIIILRKKIKGATPFAMSQDAIYLHYNFNDLIWEGLGRVQLWWWNASWLVSDPCSVFHINKKMHVNVAWQLITKISAGPGISRKMWSVKFAANLVRQLRPRSSRT